MAVTRDVIPAYLGWRNGQPDTASVRLYATDHETPGNGARWDPNHPGGRVVEYAAIERDGVEGDQYLVVRVGNRFTSDEEVERLAAAIQALCDASTGGGDASP